MSEQAGPPKSNQAAAVVPAKPTGPRSRLGFAAISLALGLAAGLVAAEVVVRLHLIWSYGQIVRPLAEASQDQAEPQTLRLADLIYRHPDPEIGFALVPGRRGPFMGQSVRVNSLGLRGEEISRPKPRGTFRLVGLGDSTMFGFGVAEERRYMDLVAGELAGYFGPDVRVELACVAVPGWTSVQEVAAFSGLVDQLEPDLVIIQFDSNDLEVNPNLSRPRLMQLKKFWLGSLPDVLSGAAIQELVWDKPALTLPRRYRGLGGWDAQAAAYLELQSICRELDIGLIATTPVWFHRDGEVDYPNKIYEQFAMFCTDAKIPLVQALGRQIEFGDQHDLDLDDPFLFLLDRHANRSGHILIASALVPQVIEAVATFGAIPEPAPGSISEPAPGSTPGPTSSEFVGAALARLERKLPRPQMGGMHRTEWWGEIQVRWSQDSAWVRFKPESSSLVFSYLVRTPDVSAQNPLKVSLSIDGGAAHEFEHEAEGYFTRTLELPSPTGGDGDGELTLRINVSRVFRESAEGRRLGIAVYPLAFK